MIIFKSIDKLNKEINLVKNIGFVPTMGSLHKGHISLINKSKKMGYKTLVSIFVNPKQFNNKKDFLNYPRNIAKDLEILKKTKANYVLVPQYTDIYEKKEQTKFKISKKDKIMCAKFRPGHFEGVLDVISRYLLKIKVKSMFLGEKDYQQFFIIKKYIKDKFNVKIINCKTIRHNNLRAYSSRNRLLKKKHLYRSDNISKILKSFRQSIIKKFNNKDNIFKILEKIKKFNIIIEYLEIRNKNNLSLKFNRKNFKIFIAYYISKVRIIDNF